MNQLLADLVRLLELERLEMNLFRGESRDIGSPQVFGGQVLGQALMAACATVEGRLVHSLHAYFLRRGDFNAPIVYEVDRSRDGASFSSRRVVAIQHGAADLQHGGLVPDRGGRAGPPGADARGAAARGIAGSHDRGAQASFAHAGRATTLLVARATVRVPFGRSGRGGRAAARRAQPLVPSRRSLPGRPGPAPLPAGLHVGLPPARDGDAAARPRVPLGRRDAREHRPRDVVPSAAARGRVAAVCAHQPEQFRFARTSHSAASSTAKGGWSRARRRKA